MEIVFEKLLVVALGMMITISLGTPLLMRSIDFMVSSQEMLEWEEFSENLNNIITMVDSGQVNSIQQLMRVPQSARIMVVDRELVIVYQPRQDINRTFIYTRSLRISGFVFGSWCNVHVYSVASDWIYINFLPN